MRNPTRVPARIVWTRGCWRRIRPDRARDEDLDIFLWMSKHARRVTARDLDELIRPA